MSEIEQRSVIHFYYKKGKTPQQIHPKLVDVYEKDAYTLKSMEYWYHQFKCGRNSIEDASRAGDQSWFFLTYEPRNKWSLSAEEVPNRISKAIHTQKVMITIMFTKHELLLVDLMPQGQSFNSEYFISNVMIPTLQRFQEATGKKKAKYN